MSRDKRSFITHRCASMPEGYSLRRYDDDGSRFQYPEPGGWVLGHLSWDSEWDVDYLEQVTPFRKTHVMFCPWCGGRLEACE